VEYGGYNYTFIVPKICGNFALLSRTAVVAAAPPPAPAPVPPPPPEPAPAQVAAPPPAPTPLAASTGSTYPWVVTGFIGSTFGVSQISNSLGAAQLPIAVDVNDGGATYGFQLGYLWRQYVGGEFIGDFAPNFRISSLALAKDPAVNSWMFNAIGAAPLGWFQPYISGGIGGVTLRSQTFDQTAIPIVTVQGTAAVAHNTINTARSHFGSNIGGGFFAYAGQWGIRADVRFYDVAKFSTNGLTDSTVPSDFTQALLSGLNYWRANLGVSFRW
jgi:hypothetical protein